jgi:hypothetical protein
MANVTVGRAEHHVTIAVDVSGRLTAVSLPRWGETAPGRYGERVFRVACEDERTFDGYTIPSRYRAGWSDGDDGADGEWFRAVIDEAEFH